MVSRQPAKMSLSAHLHGDTTVKIQDMVTWVTMGAMLIGAGIWLGKLQQQVSDMSQKQINSLIYYHGSAYVPAPEGASK